jgi:hypothetical protein
VSYVEIREQRIDERKNGIEEIASEMDEGLGIT